MCPFPDRFYDSVIADGVCPVLKKLLLMIVVIL